MARGNAKMTIYCDDVDRERFLTVLETVVEQHRIECHSYCLMSNHYHLVIRTPEPNLSAAIHYLNGVYAQWWNKRHKRVGHVLAERFKAQLIQRDGYFLEACRYVVLNAVRAGLVKNVEDWTWSSYAATAGLAPRPQWLTTRLILGPRPATMRQEYRAFIAAGIPESDAAAAIRSPLPIVGSKEFAAAHRDLIEQADPTEVTRGIGASAAQHWLICSTMSATNGSATCGSERLVVGSAIACRKSRRMSAFTTAV